MLRLYSQYIAVDVTSNRLKTVIQTRIIIVVSIGIIVIAVLIRIIVIADGWKCRCNVPSRCVTSTWPSTRVRIREKRLSTRSVTWVLSCITENSTNSLQRQCTYHKALCWRIHTGLLFPIDKSRTSSVPQYHIHIPEPIRMHHFDSLRLGRRREYCSSSFGLESSVDML